MSKIHLWGPSQADSSEDSSSSFNESFAASTPDKSNDDESSDDHASGSDTDSNKASAHTLMNPQDIVPAVTVAGKSRSASDNFPETGHKGFIKSPRSKKLKSRSMKSSGTSCEFSHSSML